MRNLINNVKIVLVVMVCLCFSSSPVFAAVSHFTDGSTTVQFPDYGVSMDFPADWAIVTLDTGNYRICPDDENTDVYLMLTFYDHPDSKNQFDAEDTFLKLTVEATAQAHLGKPLSDEAEIIKLSNGMPVAIAGGSAENTSIISTCIHYDDYMVSLSEVFPNDYEISFADDIVSILISIDELQLVDVNKSSTTTSSLN